MSKLPAVSIIMPAYNAAKTILESVQSVFEQTFSNWELLIINDGSKDNTLEVLSSLKDARIKILTQQNQGVASARNHGLREARGRYIAFLDSDDLWLPSKLEKQIAIFEQCDDEVGLVYTRHRGFTRHPLESFSMDIDVSLGLSNPYHCLLVADYIPTLTVMIRSSLVSEIGYFNEKLHGTEDWDYWLRIVKSHGLHRVDEELALYRLSPNSLSGNREKHFIQEWKVIEAHVIASPSLPKRVINMSVIHWKVKKTIYLINMYLFKDAVREILEIKKYAPIYLINIYYAVRYFFVAKIVRIINKVQRR
jgi:glycosyltransferase involved in cell wall biosynthesis